MDHEALACVREQVLRILFTRGIACETDAGVVWTGIDVTDEFRVLTTAGIWEDFSKVPKVQELFGLILGDTPAFVGVSGFEFIVPHQLSHGVGARVQLPHQDGLYTPLPELRSFWMPLNQIDREIGGLVLAAGSHKLGWFQDVARRFTGEDGPEAPRGYTLKPDSMPAEWFWAPVSPGDLIVFHGRTLHGGLANKCGDGRLRLSFNVRAQPQSAYCPPVFLRPGEVDVATLLTTYMELLVKDGVRGDRLNDLYQAAIAGDIDIADPAARLALIAADPS